MPEESTPAAGKSYQIGDVGANARVQQGEHLSWVENYTAATPGGEDLVRRFEALLEKLAADPQLDEDTRALTVEKTETVARTLPEAPEEPERFKRVLLDAKMWLQNSATWAWQELAELLRSEAAQKTIGTIADTGLRAAIAAILGA